GISQYIPARERALGKEAIANLKLIAAAERIYRMETGRYCTDRSTPACHTLNAINTQLKLSLTTTNWTYAIRVPVSGGFTATADRNGSGGYLDCAYTLAHNDADGEPDPNNRCP
ncbi:MAG: hypothetical protein NC928_03750, partial [Candidatus Omnitrophica bacterium]|nr:hypothetical protein [Candidatus Omnitrophota bacterium]